MKKDNKENKITLFFITSLVLSLGWATLAIIMSLALYFAREGEIPLILSFLCNLGILAIPSFIMAILSFLFFKKQYPLKYKLSTFAFPLVVAICEHIIFIYII